MASKAKVPAIAGGAAVAGLAGGIALSRNDKGKKLQVPRLNKGSTTKALGSAARSLGSVAVEVGKAGYRIGELTAEVRRVREQVKD